MTVEFTRKGQTHGPRGIILRHAETGQEMLVAVVDKFPQMEDVHIEGRRVVEVSVEFFLQLLQTQGFYPVDPTAKAEAPEQPGLEEDE